MILLAFILGAAGLACLGLINPKHHDWALGPHVQTLDRKLLRGGACSALAASLAASMLGWGAAQGSAGWFGLLTLAAAMLLILRTYLSGQARR